MPNNFLRFLDILTNRSGLPKDPLNFAERLGGTGGALPINPKSLMRTPGFVEGSGNASATRPRTVTTPPPEPGVRAPLPPAQSLPLPDVAERPRQLPAPPAKATFDRRYDQERYDALNRPNPRGFKQHVAELAKNFAAGAAVGAQSGDPWAALGAGLTSTTAGAINPRIGRQMQFETFHAPRLLREEAMQTERQQQQARREHAQLQNQNLESQMAARQADSESQRALNDARQREVETRTQRPDYHNFNPTQGVLRTDANGHTSFIREPQLATPRVDPLTDAKRKEIESRTAANEARVRRYSETPLSRTRGTGRDALTPTQQRTFYNKLANDVQKFEQMKQGKAANDPAVLQEFERLRMLYDPEEVELGTGEAGYPYAKARMLPGGSLTVGAMRRQLRAKGYTDADIDDLFARKGVR